MNRRGEYSWGKTSLANLKLVPSRREYKLDEMVRLDLGFQVLGGLRESFTPDVWTVAWEDNDKMVRLTMESSIRKGGPVIADAAKKPLATTGKEVRRAKFYWSRDPDLPFRIWTAVIFEDGSAPFIPQSVDDAKTRFLDVLKTFEIPARSIGPGSHKFIGTTKVTWGRRSYLEKGNLSGRTDPVQVKID